MLDSDVESAFAHWGPRFITQGMDSNDFSRVGASVTDWKNWLTTWTKNGDMHAGLATQAQRTGHGLTAGNAWLQAALNYHFAKFVWVLDMDRNREATQLAIDALANAHRFLDPTAMRLEIPFEGTKLVGNLRFPLGVLTPPLVILLPGLDSTKEEFFHWENNFLTRGLATFSMDGPGQGEVGFSLPLRYDYDVATSAVLDFLATRTDINSERIGIAGVSMGGYYAARSAACDQRIKVVVTVGGPYENGSRFDARPEISRSAFIAYSRSVSHLEAKRLAERMSLEGLLGDQEQPMLIIFGKKDRLVPFEHAIRIASEVKNSELVMYEEGNHVCNNLPYLYKPLAGDWLADQLRI